MAYRIGKDVTYRQMYIDIYRFMRELTSISEINYESSNGNGAVFELSAPAATSTTETWTLQCEDDTYPARFSVMGNLTGYTADAYVDSLYNNGIISFTLKDGTETWVVGDIISFSTRSAVYTAWEPRTIAPEGAPEKPPLMVTAIRQKQPQYGSEWLGSRRGLSYLISGPKNGSWAMRPYKKSRNSSYWNDNYNTSSYVNYVAYGGPINVQSLGNTDANAPYNFTFQAYVKNIFTDRQHYGDESTGEVFYSVVDNNVSGGTLTIQFRNHSVRVGIKYKYCCLGDDRYTYYSSYRWYKDFDIESFLASTNKTVDDWFMVTVKVDRDNNQMELFLDKTSIGVYSNQYINESRPVIGGIGSMGDVADPVIWRGLLSETQIHDIYDSPDAVNPWAPEVYDAFMWDEKTTCPLIDMENKDNLGNVLTVQMYPHVYPYFSYRYDSLHQSSIIRNGHNDPERQHMNSMYYHNDTHQWHDKGTHAEVYTLGAHPTDTIVDKYWVVATNEYIVCVFKIFDQSTVQQLPVYQTFYIGRGDSLQDKLYTTVMGTRSTGNDYWYTASDSFKSGMYYQWNCVWFGQWLWQLPTRIGAPSHRGTYTSAGNSFNVWSVFHGSNYASDVPSGRSSSDRMYAWNGWGIHYGNGLWAPELMGTFYGLYGIQALETTPEDLVIIDGIEHLAYTDCTQSGENSMMLLRLE